MVVRDASRARDDAAGSPDFALKKPPRLIAAHPPPNPPPQGGRASIWLPPPLWGRVGVGGRAAPDEAFSSATRFPPQENVNPFVKVPAGCLESRGEDSTTDPVGRIEVIVVGGVPGVI